MTNNEVRVAVNGYGVIGKRVADAVRRQPDMRLIGVSDLVTDYRIRTASSLGLPIYAAQPDQAEMMRAEGVAIAGDLDALLAEVDAVVGCTPAGVGARNLARHQEHGVKTVIPDLDVLTIAAKAAHTQIHNHFWVVSLTRSATRDDVLEAFSSDSRIAFVRADDGITAPNHTVELMKDLGRPRGDMYEVAIWEDILEVNGRELLCTYQVDNQAVVIPENIDAIRALVGVVDDAGRSMQLTDEALGIRRDFLN